MLQMWEKHKWLPPPARVIREPPVFQERKTAIPAQRNRCAGCGSVVNLGKQLVTSATWGVSCASVEFIL